MQVLLWMLSTLSLGLSVFAVTSEDTDLPVNQDESVDQFQNILMDKSSPREKSRQRKILFNLIGLDVELMNQECINGDLVECSKYKMIGSIINFFDPPEYFLNKNSKDAYSKRVLEHEAYQPYRYSGPVRSNKSEWDQSIDFGVENAEKFIQTAAVKADVPSRIVKGIKIHAPRFLDEIADEIDTLENKKDSLFSRHRLRELLIPMLIVLKLFKLKLLLFLPLILSFASLKKFLGFMAIVVPVLIGFFKLCKPIMSNYQPPVYSKNGLHTDSINHGYLPVQQNSYDDATNHQNNYHFDGVSLGQNLAYQNQKKY